MRNRAATISLFADAMRVNLPADQLALPQPGELRKIGDDWNRAAELRFRDEEDGVRARYPGTAIDQA